MNESILTLISVALFIAIHIYRRSTARFDWKSITLAGLITTLLYALYVWIGTGTIPEFAWVAIIGIPAVLIGSIIANIVANIVWTFFSRGREQNEMDNKKTIVYALIVVCALLAWWASGFFYHCYYYPSPNGQGTTKSCWWGFNLKEYGYGDSYM